MDYAVAVLRSGNRQRDVAKISHAGGKAGGDLYLQLITHAVYGADDLFIGSYRLDLLAQVFYMAVHRAIGDDTMVVIDGIQQLVS